MCGGAFLHSGFKMSLDLNSLTGSPYSARKNWLKVQEQQHHQQQQQHIEYRFSRPIKIVDYDNERYSWSAPGSPYHIRRPAFDRNRLWYVHEPLHTPDDAWLRQLFSCGGRSICFQTFPPSNQPSILLISNITQQPRLFRLPYRIEDDTSSESEVDHKQRRIITELGAEDAFTSSDPPASMLNAETDAEPKFPITIRSARSLLSLRMRRDPQHQGTRTIKARRVINKKGEGNVHLAHLPQRSLRFVRDLATTLVDEQWRYTLMLFVLSFVASWIFFAILWYLIAYAHGDLLTDPATGKRLGDGNKPCVEGTASFTGFLLFSVETQVSTGYGVIVPTEECPEAFFLLLVQIIFGLVIGGAMVGVVYAKMIRLPKRSYEMKFSKRAVICMRDGKLCFVFRVCDPKQQHVIGTKVTATMLEPRRHPGTNVIERYESRLKLQNDGRILPLWPITVCHVIDRYSPLYDLSAADLLERRFEIVITMTGGTMTTGQGTQARTSYLPVEILWGHRFQNIIEYDPQRESFVAMNEQLDLLDEVDTPLCSARQLEAVIDELHNDQHRSEDYPMADDDSRLGASFRYKTRLRSNPSSFVRFHDVYSEAEEEAHSEEEGGKSYPGSLKDSQTVTVAIDDSIPEGQIEPGVESKESTTIQPSYQK
ncbi:ATP-sensitive inward rectifier potassium channel 11-like isoform X2 [Anopheles stephensi]|uniref:ATP-sensitive inward rectifier potassium channel 11-like isoform X2 n=1 Tax=Anopheles stephensi TaxID=30069 RepID=UPI001658A861|nr:ATP-sensitive inward rectifier potassium channel 11-like isoform X2 [Anopheles stephensi]